MKTRMLITLTLVALAAPPAAAFDWIVDASGATSPYTTIDQAMVLASPGDRVLVLPGNYPLTHFSRGVELIGLGADPTQVVVERIAYHVSIPVEHYDTRISNLTIQSTNPFDTLLLHGNELAAGTLVLDGVDIRGGVFLRSGENGFFLLMNDCNVTPAPGHGFSGEAVYVGGPAAFVEIRNSNVDSWDADASQLAAAGLGVRFVGGTTARVTGSKILGGDGQDSAGYRDGGIGIASAAPGLVDLTLEGSAIVSGGAGAGVGAGGHGVAIPGTVEVAAATVTGGAGTPPGLPYSMAQPSAGGPDLSITVAPTFEFALGRGFAVPGDTISFSLATPPGQTVLFVSLGVEIPISYPEISIDLLSTSIVYGNSTSGVVPFVPGYDFPGLMVFVQGAFYDQGTGLWELTNTASMRIDL